MSPHPEDHVAGGDKRSPLSLPMRVGEADHAKTTIIWTRVKHNLHKADGPHRPSYLAEVTRVTSILPSHWQLYPPDLAKYLRQELCDSHMINYLQEKKVLNWSPGFTKLYALNATGDGNCLLHAISLALWGVEDSDLWLRKLLYHVMKGEYAAENESRWKRERHRYDTTHMASQAFRYNTKEWSAEWKIVVDLASPELRVQQTMGLPYECLEEFHIFIMANILRRPIIVLAENMWRNADGQPLQPMNFTGVYLPLAWGPADCFHHPILLGYHQTHFAPLLCTLPPADRSVIDRFSVPLVDCNLEMLPIHFLEREEEGREIELLGDYLVCETVEIRGRVVLCAKLSVDPPREDVFESYLKLAELRYRMYTEEQFNPENAEVLKAAGIMTVASTQQLNQKMATVSDPKQREQPSSTLTEESPAAQPGGVSGDVPNDVPTEDSVCISSIDLLASSMTKAPVDPPYIGRALLACRKPGCPYIRALESDEYCERCYKERTSSGKEAFKKCRVDSCLNSGDRRYGGLCQVCYDQNAFMNDCGVGENHHGILQDLSTSPKFSGLSARGPVHFDVETSRDGNELVDMETDIRALDTNVVNEFRVGSKQCTTPGCEFTGNPRNDGLCSRCYQESIAGSMKSTTGAGALGFLDSSPPQEISTTVGKKKCLMPECELTGHPEKGDLCSGCFMKQAEISKAAGLTVKARIASPTLDTDKQKISRPLSVERQEQLLRDIAQPCRTPKCEMFAHRGQDGFCSTCYKKSRAGKSSPGGFIMESNQLRRGRDPLTSAFRPILQFTVKKNMCAVPGCTGVRIQLGSGDLCFDHHQENIKRYSPQIRTPTPPSAASFRAAAPYVSPMRVQPSAPPQSIYASRPDSSAQLAQKSDVEICAHPSCNSPAVPPTYVACRACQEFVDKVNRVQAAMRSARGHALHRERSLIRGSSDEEISPIAIPTDPPTETIRNLDIHEKPAAMKDKLEYEPLLQCQAKGGCPYHEYGTPKYGNLCAVCFDRDIVQKHNASTSAPLKKSSPSHALPPRSRSAVLTTTSTRTNTPSRMTTARPANYRKCSRRDCYNQANVQIMEGYCNDCYPAYKARDDKKKKVAPSTRRDRHTQSSGVSKRDNPALMDDLLSTETIKCRSGNCPNYGNSQSLGYCNQCYSKIKKGGILVD